MSTRGVTSPRHMMSSIITKSQFDVCGAPTSTPLRGTSPTAVHRVAHSTNLASRLLIVFLSRTPPGGGVLRHHGTGVPRAAGRRRMAGPGRADATAESAVKERHADDSQRPPRLPPRWFIRLFWQLHRAVFRVTGGRLGLWRPKPSGWGTLRLTTTGRRTGQPRHVILGYLEDGPNLVTLAMNGWDPAEPAWWLNLQAHPEAAGRAGRCAVRGHRARGRTARSGSGCGPGGREIDKDLDAYAARRPARDRGRGAGAGAVHPRGVMPAGCRRRP